MIDWLNGLFPDFWFVMILLYFPLLSFVSYNICKEFLRILVTRFGNKNTLHADGDVSFAAAAYAPEIIITLVHGTWASDAAWTKSDSKLCQELIATMKERIKFHRFRWSGTNSFKARSDAAIALSKKIIELNHRYPTSRHFIIAHSHGGNIALAAMNDEINDIVDGVVCMATPVLVVKKRIYDPLISTMFYAIGIFPGILVFRNFDIYGPNVNSGLTIAVILSGVLAAYLFKSLIRSVRLVSDHRSIDNQKVVFIRAPGDEASLTIGLAHTVNIIAEQLLISPIKHYQKMLDILEYLSNTAVAHWVLTTIFVFCNTAMLFWTLGLDNKELAIIIGNLNISGIFMVIALILKIHYLLFAFILIGYSSILLLPLFIITAIIGLVIGPELALIAIVTYVTAEVCPEGRWSVIQIPAESVWSTPKEQGLQHSIVYESSDALLEISNWIVRRFNYI